MSKKYYMVNLYRIDAKDNSNSLQFIDKVAVEKRKYVVKEIITGQSIDILDYKRCMNEENRVNSAFINYDFMRENGFHLLMLDKDFTDENKLTEELLIPYFKDFSSNNFNIYYERIHNKNILKEKFVKCKIKRLANSK